MANDRSDDNEENGQDARETITIAEKNSPKSGAADKDTITIAEKEKPKNP